jgi:pimeloyl-ACP methyl ester carboxylesterase
MLAPSVVPAATARPRTALTAPVRTIRTALGTVDYRSLGRGRPLVMIMGLDGSIDAWPPGLIDALARSHRVYALDNEGIGRSTLRPGTLTISRMADDTAAFIAALRLKRPDVLGWSMGGFIAQALAVRHPQAYRRLILAATAPGTGHAVSPTGAVLKALTGNPAELLTFLFPPDQPSWAAKYAAAIAKYPHLFLAPSAVDTLQLAASARWISGGERSGRKVDRVQRPVLIADGARDVILPTANSRLLHRLIKHSRLHLYPDAGHGFLFQDQAPFVKLINRFLAAAAPSRG